MGLKDMIGFWYVLVKRYKAMLAWLFIFLIFGSSCSVLTEPSANNSIATVYTVAPVEQLVNPTPTYPTVTRMPLIQASATPTSTSAPTSTSTIVAPSVPTKTKIASSTTTPTATAVVEPLISSTTPLVGPLIGYRGRSNEPLGDGWDELVILDIGTASYRVVWNELMNRAFDVQWHGNGCLLEIWNGALFDLKGNIVLEELDLNMDILLDNKEGSVLERGGLSPDRQWWAYVYGHGERFEEYDSWSEFYDIALIDVEKPDKPIHISDGGVSGYFQWSPDGQWLYYKSVDENGIRQFYRYSPESGESKQLTNFDDDKERLFPKISPDGRFLATATYVPYRTDEGDKRNDSFETSLHIVNLSDMSMKEIPLESLDGAGNRPYGVWWSLSEPTVAVLGHDSAGESLVFWADVTAGEIVDSLSIDELPWDSGGTINPAGSGDKLLLTSGIGDHYLYDRTTKKMVLLPVGWPEHIIYDMSLAPFDFPGEDNCEQ